MNQLLFCSQTKRVGYLKNQGHAAINRKHVLGLVYQLKIRFYFWQHKKDLPAV